MHKYNLKLIKSVDKNTRKTKSMAHVSAMQNMFLQDKEYQYNLNLPDADSDDDSE